MRFHPLPWGGSAFVAVLAADQGSKWWVLSLLELPRRGDIKVMSGLDFTMVWNRGVTFGLLNGLRFIAPLVLALAALAVVLALAAWLRRARSRPTALALGAIAGGAVGNVIDRLRYGAVVDFIRAHAFGWSWYVFNIADAAIVCGVAVLLFGQFLPRAARSGLAEKGNRR